MPPELMQWEKDVIINSMLRKSSKEIALALDLDEKTVADFISISAGKDTTTMDQKIYERKILREQNKPDKKRSKPKSQGRQQRITSAQLTYAGVKKQEKVYKNRKLNFHELVPVKIDAKTYIYVKPGDDVEKARRDFINTYNNQIIHKHQKNAIRSTKPYKGIQV